MNSILRLPGRHLLTVVLVAAACLGALVGAPALAQSPDVDPPGRVARIAETFGQVWIYTTDTGEWISALRNRPVTSGDRLATDVGARVELNLGSTTLRLDGGSEIEVRRLDDNLVALQLHNGSAAVHVRDAQAVGEFEMTTEEGRLRLQRAGHYRFDRLDRATHLTVYDGQAVYEGPGSALTLYAGQRGQFWLEANGAAQYSLTEPVRDAFASWNSERDRNEDRMVSTARFVSPEMTGAQDLDRYGSWEQSPDYGPLWFPRGVASGWAPYSAGHWAWVRPWGWTWVDDAPWGFAPFHYGRWVHYRSNWCWAPGTFVARPVYAPALVAWVGGPRANVSISIGGGPAVGWFPLAPHEVYVPGYHASPRYVREVNVTHVTDATRIRDVINNPNGAPRDYANRKYPHAVTVVPASVLTNREAVAPAAARARDLPAVRALVNEPARTTALLSAPVASPPPAQRGVEARPFRPSGEAAAGGRSPRPSTNAAEDARRGIPERAQAGRAPVNATEQAQRGTSGPPLTPAVPDGRAARDRRDAAASPAATVPAAVPVTAVRPAAAPTPPVAVVPVAPAGPAARPVPPPPRQGKPPAEASIGRPPISAAGEAEHGVPVLSPPAAAARDRRDSAPSRPERIEPALAPAVRPAEAPRPAAPAAEARPPQPAAAEQRPHLRPPEAPPRDERRDPADRTPAR